MSAGLLTIGEVAGQTGIAVSAVRYYDRIGVIHSAQRIGGQRRFSPNTMGRVSFIRKGPGGRILPRRDPIDPGRHRR